VAGIFCFATPAAAALPSMIGFAEPTWRHKILLCQNLGHKMFCARMFGIGPFLSGLLGQDLLEFPDGVTCYMQVYLA